MTLQRLKSDYPNIEILKAWNLVEKKEDKSYSCKHCGYPNISEVLSVSNEFWQCSNCNRKNKLNKSKELCNVNYLVKITNINRAIKKKVEQMGIEFIKEGEDIYIKINDKKLPLVVLDFSFNQSSLIDALENKFPILYFLDSNKKLIENIYSSSHLMNFCDFLNSEKNELIQFLEVCLINLKKSRILKIKRKLKKFNKDHTSQDFEIKVKSLLDSLKSNEEDVRKMISFFNKNMKNPTGTKFVHIGGNYVSDIMPINLHDYLNKLLEVLENKSYDTKLYSNKLTKSDVERKYLTNIGRMVVLICNEEVTSGVWQVVFDSKQNNNGEWFVFVIDKDILTLILNFVGDKDFFDIIKE